MSRDRRPRSEPRLRICKLEIIRGTVQVTRPRGGERGGRGKLVPPPRGSPGGPQGATTHAHCLWARPQHVLGAAHRRSSLRRDPGPARLRWALPGTGVCRSCGAGLLSGHALRGGSEGPVRSPARAKATSQKPSPLTLVAPALRGFPRPEASGFRRKFLPRGRSTGQIWSRPSTYRLSQSELLSLSGAQAPIPINECRRCSGNSVLEPASGLGFCGRAARGPRALLWPREAENREGGSGKAARPRRPDPARERRARGGPGRAAPRVPQP